MKSFSPSETINRKEKKKGKKGKPGCTFTVKYPESIYNLRKEEDENQNLANRAVLLYTNIDSPVHHRVVSKRRTERHWFRGYVRLKRSAWKEGNGEYDRIVDWLKVKEVKRPSDLALLKGWYKRGLYLRTIHELKPQCHHGEISVDVLMNEKEGDEDLYIGRIHCAQSLVDRLLELKIPLTEIEKEIRDTKGLIYVRKDKYSTGIANHNEKTFVSHSLSKLAKMTDFPFKIKYPFTVGEFFSYLSDDEAKKLLTQKLFIDEVDDDVSVRIEYMVFIFISFMIKRIRQWGGDVTIKDVRTGIENYKKVFT